MMLGYPPQIQVRASLICPRTKRGDAKWVCARFYAFGLQVLYGGDVPVHVEIVPEKRRESGQCVARKLA